MAVEEEAPNWRQVGLIITHQPVAPGAFEEAEDSPGDCSSVRIN